MSFGILQHVTPVFGRSVLQGHTVDNATIAGVSPEVIPYFSDGCLNKLFHHRHDLNHQSVHVHLNTMSDLHFSNRVQGCRMYTFKHHIKKDCTGICLTYD